jgi:hypothetical protein
MTLAGKAASTDGRREIAGRFPRARQAIDVAEMERMDSRR